MRVYREMYSRTKLRANLIRRKAVVQLHDAHLLATLARRKARIRKRAVRGRLRHRITDDLHCAVAGVRQG